MVSKTYFCRVLKHFSLKIVRKVARKTTFIKDGVRGPLRPVALQYAKKKINNINNFFNMRQLLGHVSTSESFRISVFIGIDSRTE